jgi:replication-associated recombination protein RarA
MLLIFLGSPLFFDFALMAISLSLANKYRPQTFDEMLGQQYII